MKFSALLNYKLVVLTYAFTNAKMCFLNVLAIFNMTSKKQKLFFYLYKQKRVLDEKNDPLLTIILQLAIYVLSTYTLYNDAGAV